MIRGDNIICGTTTTGTGTLTLAAPPVPPGGIGFPEFLEATGIGFVNGNAIGVSYTIIEYTDATFVSAKAHEKGVGILTLGTAYGGGTPHTLARTTKQTSATSLDSQPATQNIAPATGISIGTAANTLVFIGASAADVLAFPPYFDSSNGQAAVAVPLQVNAGINFSSPTIASANDYYFPFVWVTPILVKRVKMSVNTAYTGGTPVSNAYARIYDVGTDGRPAKLLYDFGLLGSAGTSLNSATTISSGASGNGYFLTSGGYIFNFIVILSGGLAGPVMYCTPCINPGFFGGDGGAASFGAGSVLNASLATGGNGATPADPANVTGYSYTGWTVPAISFGFASS